MSKHTDTGRAGKKLWILIPVIAVLIIAAALVWLNSVYVYAGGLHRRDSAQIDLRGKSISEEKYLRLREQLPDCKIYWDVPIGGAAIDVFDEEPLPPDSPLLTLDNVTLTPHIAGTTVDAFANSVEIMLRQLSRVLAGEKAPNRVV